MYAAKWIVQQIATAEEVSIEWLQHKILSTYSKVQIELYDFSVDYLSERIRCPFSS